MNPDAPLVHLNGTFLPRSEARVSVDDRGFVFGDGVYEVFRSVRGRMYAPDAHMDRLREGLATLRIRIPESIADGTLLEVARRLLSENGHDEGEATIYLQVTRGSAPRTHHFPDPDIPPTVYLSTSPFEPRHDLQDSGGACILHPDRRWARAHIKTVNLLPNILAKQAAHDADTFEAILVRDGMVLEGSSTNVFGVMDGVVRTYPAANYILRGVTRDRVLALARDRGVPCLEEGLAVEELAALDELFLTGTTTDVLPVLRVDGQVIGEGTPGPITRLLQDAFREDLYGRPDPEAD